MRGRQYHLFISSDCNKCIEEGSYGVTKDSINQIANVKRGDIALFYVSNDEKKKKKKIEPYIFSPVFISSDFYYQKGYPGYFEYRVEIDPIDKDNRKSLSITQLFEIIHGKKFRSIIDISTSFQRSVINMIDKESEIILENLNINNTRLETIIRNEKEKEPYMTKIRDPKFFENKFSKVENNEFKKEIFLESYLLLRENEDKLYKSLDLKDALDYNVEIYNQVPMWFSGKAIDIVMRIEGLYTIIVELKKGKIKEESVNQLVGYIEWAQKLFPNIDKKMIKGILIGNDPRNHYKTKTKRGYTCYKKYIGKINEEIDRINNDCISCYTYNIKNGNDDFLKPFPNK